MHDNWLVAISICTAGLGITMLLFALILVEPDLSTIDDAKLMQENTPTNLKGTVQNIRTIANKTIITISQPSSIDIILDIPLELNQTSENIIIKNSCINIIGKKSSYNNRAQVIASKIKSC